MELVPKTDQEITELARGIVTNQIYAAWDPQAIDNAFGMFIQLVTSGAAAQGDDMEWLGQIGLIYEDLSKRNPRDMNGYPTFFSAQFLGHDDRLKVQRECIKMSEAIGSLPEGSLAQFDVSLTEYYETKAVEEGEG
jgi:hypothetical protein